MDNGREHRRIGDIFVEQGVISPEQLEGALLEQERSGKLLGEVLVELGLIERIHLAGALGKQWSAPLRRPEPPRDSKPAADVDHEVVALRTDNADLRATVSQLEADVRDREERIELLAQLLIEQP